MAAVLALAAAILYGSADFLGGVGSRRASALSFLAASAPVGAVIMLAAALAVGDPVTAGRLGWGLAAGAASGVGVIVFFAGLAAGPISVVAPLSALGAALLPVAAAIAEGERLSVAALAGALLCLASVALVSLGSRPATGHGRPPAIGGVACGLAAVITALYPAVTVLLARLVLGERMRAIQRAGLALGALGIILLTAHAQAYG